MLIARGPVSSARYDARMEMTFGAWALAVGVVGATAYLLRIVFSGGRVEDFDAGAVSQSWLTEHKAGKGERFS